MYSIIIVFHEVLGELIHHSHQQITRTKRYPEYGHGASLKIRCEVFSCLSGSAHTGSSVVARSNDILKRLVLEAKREYEKDAEHRVHIFMADT